ncbi:MAG: phenylalanine--tRNA ligase subunit beta, partial [Acidobacteriota bacterium]
SWENIFVGAVLEVKPHPTADRLTLVTVDLGAERHKVVCGAPNVAAGQKIAFAKLGASLIDGHTGKPTRLKKVKIRGVESGGMVCSEKELGLSEEHEGIFVLSKEAPIGTPLVEHLGETIFEIDMKPNRADGLSILGVARDVGALTSQAVREPGLDFCARGAPVEDRARVIIEDPDLCLRYTAALIEGIEIGLSPPWMQERLVAAGMRPINNVVDITNYVMLELGQPIHAFDYDTIAEHTIIVRRACPGEEMITLDGVSHAFSPDQLLITDPRGPVAVAGVMGGLETEVTEKTRNILLEVATFDPVSIRRTALVLKAPSEASRRFAWGLPPELALIASKRATKLLVELAGGRAAEGTVDAFPGKVERAPITLEMKRLIQVLGVELPEETVRDTLTSLGFSVTEKVGKGLRVEVPYWRQDVRIPDDLVEEVARIVGYDRIPSQPIAGRVPPRVPQPRRELRERVRDILAQAGMQEVVTYPLTSRSMLEQFLPADRLQHQEPLAVINPLNAGEERLRTSLRGSMLATVATNHRLQGEAFALFETARVYLPGTEALPDEVEHVVGAVTGRRVDRWGRPTEEWVDFFDAKAYLDRLFERLDLDVSYAAAEEYGLVPGRTAEIVSGDRRVGVLGQVHPRTASGFHVEQDVYLFEVVLDDVLPLLKTARRYKPLSRFPAVEEDLAVVVDCDLPAASVSKEILRYPLVVAAQLFDEYVGRPVPKGKKSLAFSVSYQAQDRTLTDKDVSMARTRILERLKKALGAELRS